MSQALQGCHKCGNHPKHQNEHLQCYKIFRCSQCGTFTCNQHLIGLLGNVCPKCNSVNVVCLFTKDTKPEQKTILSQDTAAGGVASQDSFAGAKTQGSAALGIQNKFKEKAAFIPVSQGVIPHDNSLSVNFVQGILDGGKPKNSQYLGAAVEFHNHSETHHHTHEHSAIETKAQDTLSAAVSALEAPKTSGNSAMAVTTTIIAAAPETPTVQVQQTNPPQDLPDPATLRSGLTLYSDAYFKPALDENLTKLTCLLEHINNQLAGDKNFRVLCLSIDYSEVKKNLTTVLALLDKYPFVRLIVGYGPQNIGENVLNTDELAQFINATPHVIALEAGIDMHFAAYAQKAQVTLFQQQLELANHLAKPIFINSVKADELLLEAIHISVKGIYASPFTAERSLEVCKKHNLWVCARSEMTHKGQEPYLQLISQVPTGKILLGSGSELMATAAQKTMHNSPLYIDETARVLMKLYKYQKLETVFSQCYKNLYSLLMGL